MNCVVCQNPGCPKIHSDKYRDYLRCQNCDVIFVPSTFYIKPDEEKKRYKLHLNCIQNVGYVLFLSQLANPLLEKLKHKSSGLDFGCGPEPTLSKLLEEKGHKLKLYDPYFFPEKKVFNASYDFITATEVFEHLKDPATEINQLWKILKPDGYLGIMTKLHDQVENFANWRYKDDQTHITFYSSKTFKWLNKNLQGNLKILNENVILIKK